MLNNNYLFLNIGGSEFILLVLIIILLFGAKKIPEFAKLIGKGLYEIKNITGEVQKEIISPSIEKNDSRNLQDSHSEDNITTKTKKEVPPITVKPSEGSIQRK